MSDYFNVYTEAEMLSRVNIRFGETKLGQRIRTINSLDDLTSLDIIFVLLGIPEDIGVRANGGIGGTHTAWEPALTAFLNIQSNDFLTGSEVAVAGYFDIQEPIKNDVEALRKKVSEIDALVADVIHKVASTGKIPLIIGGGHNNAFPILKGLSQANGVAINTVNVDAHADIRLVEEGRHSGNGFSTAITYGFLEKYGIYGLHENYNNQHTLDLIKGNADIQAKFFDQLPLNVTDRHIQWKNFVSTFPQPCGLEIDLDCIQGLLSSASTPTGFDLNEVRLMLRDPGRAFSYLHICEGATAMTDGRKDPSVAKAISYLLSDFIKGQNKPLRDQSI